MVTTQTKKLRPPDPVPDPPEYDDADGIEDEGEEDPNSPYISMMQACKRYDISRQALHTLCAQGKVPYYVRYNGRRRFLREEADEYLGMARVEPTNPLPKRGRKG